MREALGRLLNWLGWPGFVQESDHMATAASVIVRVRKTRLFTVITVNGVDVYFDRLTGRIDGTGVSAKSGLLRGPIGRSMRSAAAPGSLPDEARSKIQLADDA